MHQGRPLRARWRAFCLIIALIALVAPAGSASADDGVAKLQRFEFRSNLHVNQHHFLHALARDRRDPADYLEAHARPGMDEPSLASMLSAMAYYREHLAKRDLLFDGYLSKVKLHLMKHDSGDALTQGRMDPEHFHALQTTRVIYERHFWPQHDAANRALVANTESLLRTIELPTLERIEQLAGSTFPKHWTVHLSWFANRQGAYTSTSPTTIAVIQTSQGGTPEGRDDFIEIVFHEPTHAVISPNRGPVALAIKAAAQALGVKPPSQLWHAIHFYIVGIAVKEQLAAQGRDDYELYMKRNDVFKRMHKGVFRGLPEYAAGKVTLQEAVERVLSTPEPPRR